ncbi:MAG: hypothetical protein HOH74_11515, partial [Gemmatimonadetes bacterium]|nr:hypothetical protein [Gemmatimonadota bacterium]
MLYVTDAGTDTIRKFRTAGTNASQEIIGAGWPITGKTSTDDGFSQPWDVVVDSNGYLFILDRMNARVGRFFADGTPYDATGAAGIDFLKPEGVLAFDRPQALTIDGADSLYVADTESNRVRVFGSAQPWTANAPTETMTLTPSGAKALSAPRGLAVNTAGVSGAATVIYVADSGNDRVSAFTVASYDAGTGDADYATGYPISGSSIDNPTAVTLDEAAGSLYVIEAGILRNRVGVYTADRSGALSDNQQLFSIPVTGRNDEYVTLHLDEAENAIASTGTAAYDLYFTGQTTTWLDLLGNAIDTIPQPGWTNLDWYRALLIDYADPRIRQVELFDPNNDGDIDQVVVTFTEDMDKTSITSLNALQYTLGGTSFTHVDSTTDATTGIATTVGTTYYNGNDDEMVLLRSPETAGAGTGLADFIFTSQDGTFQDQSATTNKTAEELASVSVPSDLIVDRAAPVPVTAVVSPWPTNNGRLVENATVDPYLDVTFSEDITVAVSALANAHWVVTSPLGDSVELGNTQFTALNATTVRITFLVDAAGTTAENWIDGATINLRSSGSYAIEDAADNQSLPNTTAVTIQGLSDSTKGTPEYASSAALDQDGNGRLDKIIVWLDDDLMTADGHGSPAMTAFAVTDADGTTALTVTSVTVARNRIEILLGNTAGTTASPSLTYVVPTAAGARVVRSISSAAAENDFGFGGAIT